MRKLLLVTLLVLTGAVLATATARVAAYLYPGEGGGSQQATAQTNDPAGSPAAGYATLDPGNYGSTVKASVEPVDPQLELVQAPGAAAGYSSQTDAYVAHPSSLSGSTDELQCRLTP